jgi:murein DD-endopeptidase MepM/ murein hydrolase activator NlpD
LRILAKNKDFLVNSPKRKYRKYRPVRMAVSLISLLLITGTLLPAVARASLLDVIKASIRGNVAEAETVSGAGNVQTIQLPKASLNGVQSSDRGGADITIVDSSALVPDEGPSGTLSKPANATISTYVVREGDTLSEIAELFEVTPDTIRWANDLTRGSQLRVGQTLTILPVTGIKYTVRKSDTLSSIAKRFEGDAIEIASYNGIDESSLAVGEEIIIPNGEIQAAPAPAPKKSNAIAKVVKSVSRAVGYFSSPLSSYIKTQGIHGYNGVDMAAPVGTAILAAADGNVIVAKRGGYNGGYGSYVVIQHDNGSQTLYAHASSVSVSVGERVSRGEVIGGVGNTGRSTGAHLHFEIRNGGVNPF